MGQTLISNNSRHKLNLISSTSPILFDATGDGIKTATGWIKADDGLLVLDRNGNRTIDSGLELFGDSTRMSNGQLATNGFEALADLDTNHDGAIDSNDAQFSDLRVWQDLNQDGISPLNELCPLSDKAFKLKDIYLYRSYFAFY